ncbi:MAG: DNA mismatch repair protein MutS, partial [Acidobacteriota bacterium]
MSAPKKTSTKKTQKLTPMLRHYLETKAEHPDAILLYRMGDFFELFFDDAVEAAPILEVTLTARQKGTPSEAPMAGVPHHAIDAYIGKLLRAGYKVAICDQVEDPKQAKGLVRREVTRIVTPGTISEPELLDGKEENLLAAIVWNDDTGAGAMLDVSTGVFFVRRWPSESQARDELAVIRPREVLHFGDLPTALDEWMRRDVTSHTEIDDADRLDNRRATELLCEHFACATLRGFGIDDHEPAARAAATALDYAQRTPHSDLEHVTSLSVRDLSDVAVLDATTLTNLEVFRNLREGGRRGTLIGVVDRTVTSPGGRLLRDWLRRPSRALEPIRDRHEAVAELVNDDPGREHIRQLLGGVGDPERLLARAVLGTMSPREAVALRSALRVAPDLLDAVAGRPSVLLREIAGSDVCAALARELDRVLAEDPGSLADGGVIADGVDPELDHNRSLARDAKKHMLAFEAREREATGISSLKIRYNKVFGYYLEVTKANQDRVPEHYIRKQTLVNAERYITPEIKELEEEVLGAEETQLRLEAEHFARLLVTITDHGAQLSKLARAFAHLDVLTGLADVAVKYAWSRPKMTEAGEPLIIEDGRHPVVEHTSTEPFVPNETELDGDEAQIVVLTGPNMGGKSTYLRQVALIVLLAQAGSFVPAKHASIGVVDRIFTRVGASDDLARGDSTFMVEMIETANILHHATEHSLVVLDEVGRGTATFDGLSLAWAIVEYLHDTRRGRALFATHYHELTELADSRRGVQNYSVAVREWQ